MFIVLNVWIAIWVCYLVYDFMRGHLRKYRIVQINDIYYAQIRDGNTWCAINTELESDYHGPFYPKEYGFDSKAQAADIVKEHKAARAERHRKNKVNIIKYL